MTNTATAKPVRNRRAHQNNPERRAGNPFRKIAQPHSTQERADADTLFRDAFAAPRDPRSEEYKAGVLYILRRKTGQIAEKQNSPYPAGSAQADAWLAGIDEGLSIYQQNKLTAAR